MHILPPVADISADELLKLTINGQSIGGRRFDFNQLLLHLPTSRADYKRLVIQDAIINELTLPEGLFDWRLDPPSVLFHRCRFFGDTLLTAKRLQPVYVNECEFFGSTLIKLTGHDVQVLFENTHFTKETYLDWTDICSGECNFEKSTFDGSLKIKTCPDTNIDEFDPVLRCYECRFFGDVNLKPMMTLPQFDLSNCFIEPGATVRIDESHGMCGRVEFGGSTIEGSIVVEPNLSAEKKTFRDIDQQPFCFGFDGVTCSGKVDLRACRNLVLDTGKGASFSTSSMVIEADTKLRLTSELDATDTLWSCVFQNIRSLLRCSQQAVEDDVGLKCGSNSRQYLALVGSFENVTLTNDPDSSCVYRGGVYRVFSDIHLQGFLSLILGWMVLAGWMVATYLTAIGYVSWQDSLPIIVGLPITGTIVALLLRDNSISRNIRIHWNLIVIWGVLGFGVRAMHPLISCAVLISVFSSIYFVGTNNFRETGYVCVPQLANDIETCANSMSISDSTYFSIVTFTTLGYGDFKPIGQMRAIASLEAVTGALMLALFTAVLVRRFLRV